MLLKPLGFMRAGGGDPVLDDLPGTATAVFYNYLGSGTEPTSDIGGLSGWAGLDASGIDFANGDVNTRPSLTTFDGYDAVRFTSANSEFWDLTHSGTTVGDYWWCWAWSPINMGPSFATYLNSGIVGTPSRIGWQQRRSATANVRHFQDNSKLLAIDGAWHVDTLVVASGTASVYRDGVFQFTVSGASITYDAWRIGDTTESNRAADMYVNAVRCGTGTITTAYRETMETALGARVGLTI